MDEGSPRSCKGKDLGTHSFTEEWVRLRLRAKMKEKDFCIAVEVYLPSIIFIILRYTFYIKLEINKLLDRIAIRLGRYQNVISRTETHSNSYLFDIYSASGQRPDNASFSISRDPESLCKSWDVSDPNRSFILNWFFVY